MTYYMGNFALDNEQIWTKNGNKLIRTFSSFSFLSFSSILIFCCCKSIQFFMNTFSQTPQHKLNTNKTVKKKGFSINTYSNTELIDNLAAACWQIFSWLNPILRIILNTVSNFRVSHFNNTILFEFDFFQSLLVFNYRNLYFFFLLIQIF